MENTRFGGKSVHITRMLETSAFIHRFVPGEEDGPVLLLLHGTGGDENDLLDLGRSLLPGAALLSPRGKVLENGMPRFFRRLAEGVFDEADLIQRTHELADFVDAALAEYHLQGRRVVAVGYSNGANIAASILLLRPSTLAWRNPPACHGSNRASHFTESRRSPDISRRRKEGFVRPSTKYRSTRCDASECRR